MAQSWEHRVRLMLVKDARFESTVAASLIDSALRLYEVDTLHIAVEQVWQRSPDLLLLESRSEHDAAAAFCQQLRPFFQFPILVLEQGASEAERIQLLDSGADTILPYTSSFAELLAHFNALLRRVTRQQRLDPHIHYMRVHTMDLDIGGRRLLLPGRQIDLPLSLIKLLAILFYHYDSFVSREAIAQHVFGSTSPPAQTRISALVNLLRRRIEHELGLAPIIVSVMGRGYRLIAAPDEAPLDLHLPAPQ